MPKVELLATCQVLKLKRVAGHTFLFKGHEIDLSNCGHTPIEVMTFIAGNLADKLHNNYLAGLEELFGERLAKEEKQ